ncbi:cytochrome c3 family protein [Aromatoleum evansii]|uniref:Cytochrome c3 family protein n=1 Tax=Aromatoleum evansii TaxID=59406 RepID=A0ABZ1AUL3_AROEV|nr:cytochrome c3 family protein [Aromatoleum evansii]
MLNKIATATIVTIGVLASDVAWSGTRSDSEFLQQGTIGNTRHNLTQRQTAGGGPTGTQMDAVRNNYEQVCVYCHTPHGANQNIKAPLWNRTVRTTTYTLYSQLSLSQDATQPGPSSLTCLSCHDGQTAVDSIINMPGSGKYNAALALNPDAATTKTLLDAWSTTDDAFDHYALKDNNTECLSCHSPSGQGGAQDFSAYALGTDLRNDHPVGVKLPTGAEWNVPSGTYQNIRFFDTDGDNRPDKNELRFYDSGQGFEVECASCHDPHGVPGATAKFLPTFLRVTVDASQICLTCHVK